MTRPLGQLIRSRRLERKMSLASLAKVCRCSVQFISNIEHGRAPLPWGKIKVLARRLEMDPNRLEEANLASRADFRKIVGSAGHQGTLSILAAAARDTPLQEVIARYNGASPEDRRKFIETALRFFNV